MKKINIEEIEKRRFESPKKRFCKIERSLSKAIGDLEAERPFEVDNYIVPPGKKAFTYHAHGTQWEFYLVIRGSATMRFAEGTLNLAAGDAVQCPPGVAHQLANDADSDFEYLVISNNPEFDTCYYPDSDKVSLHGRLEVDKGPLSDERDGLTVWTQVKEGLTGNYWSGEE